MARNLWKRLVQISALAIEVSVIVYILVILLNKFSPPTTGWELIERISLCYGVYQFIVYMILSSCNDIRKDSYLAVLHNYKLVMLYFESNDNQLLSVINDNIRRQLDNATLNDRDIREQYDEMKKIVANKDITQAKRKIILFEHKVEESSLMWKFSFLLRFLK